MVTIGLAGHTMSRLCKHEQSPQNSLSSSKIIPNKVMLMVNNYHLSSKGIIPNKVMLMVNNYHLSSKGVRVMKVMTLLTVSSTDEGSLVNWNIHMCYKYISDI